jgi:hypothetical protein
LVTSAPPKDVQNTKWEPNIRYQNKKNRKYQYITYITKYSSMNQELYLYNYHLINDIFFSIL